MISALLPGAMPSQASDVEFIRIRADVPTRITSFTRDGELTWTSSQPNVRWTVETTTAGASQWGAVASGLQSGTEQKVRLDLTSQAQRLISVRATYSTSPLPNFEMILQDDAYQEIARAMTNDRGECWFHHVPPGTYWVSNIETLMYAQCWYSSTLENANHFDVKVQRQVPLGMQPEGEMNGEMPFSWGTLTDCAFYRFKLYLSDTDTYQLTLLEEVPDLIDPVYASPKNFNKGWNYLWTVMGYDIWDNPVMLGSRTFTAQFTGDGGGTRRTNRLFGLVKFSTIPTGNFTIQLKNFNTLQVVAQTVTDARGYYVFSDVPDGAYALGHADPSYGGNLTTRIEVPDFYPHQGTYQLLKRSTVNLPSSHQQVGTRTPTFQWAGIPESVTYSFSLVRSSPFQVIHENHGLTATSYTPPGALADSDSYFWNVEGQDAAGNPVLQAGAGFSVKGP